MKRMCSRLGRICLVGLSVCLVVAALLYGALKRCVSIESLHLGEISLSGLHVELDRKLDVRIAALDILPPHGGEMRQFNPSALGRLLAAFDALRRELADAGLRREDDSALDRALRATNVTMRRVDPV